MVEQFVADLNADGIYAILDLHWSAPAGDVADDQRPMPDDHSAAFWTSVATTFKSDPAVLFDVFNEPYSPAANYSDAAGFPLSWACWRDGGCTLPATADGNDPGPSPQTYQAVGMQTLVTAIRSTGASQPILLGGLSYANDLTGWLAHEPTDPDDQLAASFHNYEGEACSTVSCWNDEIAPVAAQVPVVTGEFDEDQCPAAGDDFAQAYMDWADETGVSYLAWGWYVPEPCDYQLIDASDAPFAPNGTALHDHLTALAAAATTTSSTTITTSTTTTSTSTTTSTAAPPTISTPPPTTTAPPGGPTAVAPPPGCVVPRLIGDRLATARLRLAHAHCRLGRVTGPRRPRSRVAAQHPRPQTRGRSGRRVGLTLKIKRRPDAR